MDGEGNDSLPRHKWHLAFGIRHSRFLLPLLFAITILCLFFPVLFTTKQIIPSNHDSDLAILFVPLRAFATEQLRAGHIPLWNPHIFCGSPFLGNFQSALLYPLTWLHLILPLAPAINWTKLHVEQMWGTVVMLAAKNPVAGCKFAAAQAAAVLIASGRDTGAATQFTLFLNSRRRARYLTPAIGPLICAYAAVLLCSLYLGLRQNLHRLRTS